MFPLQSSENGWVPFSALQLFSVELMGESVLRSFQLAPVEFHGTGHREGGLRVGIGPSKMARVALCVRLNNFQPKGLHDFENPSGQSYEDVRFLAGILLAFRPASKPVGM